METIGKLIKVRNGYFVTIPVEVWRHWKSVLMEDVDIVSLNYDNGNNELVIYPRQILKQGLLRKVIKRGDTWIITLPREIGSRWEGEGVVYLAKKYDEKLLKFTVTPV